ncbi:MAG: hypothetical protein O7C65_10405 [Planctomycetota bacterium]|nr:hypothetical protein [Planctomycetota bacterium]
MPEADGTQISFPVREDLVGRGGLRHDDHRGDYDQGRQREPAATV